MEETRNTPALVLKRQAYRENDSLVTVYTQEFGKLNLVARGTKKLRSKLAGHLEPANLIDLLIIKGKNRDYIGSAINRQAYLGLKDNLNKLYYGGQALAWFNRLIKEGEPDQPLFLLLSRWLEIINDYPPSSFAKESGELLFIFFIWRLLAELGYKPELRQCLVCGQKVKAGQNYFNLQDGGLVGEDCFLKKPLAVSGQLLKISDNAIRLMRLIWDNTLSQAAKINAPKKTIKELLTLTNQFLKYNF